MTTIDDFLSYNFLKVHRGVCRWLNAVLKNSDLTISQFYALHIVSVHSPNNLSYMANKLCVDRTTLARVVERMSDLIELVNGDGNARVICPRLTEKGKALLECLTDKIRDIDTELSLEVSDGFMKDLSGLSSRVDHELKQLKRTDI